MELFSIVLSRSPRTGRDVFIIATHSLSLTLSLTHSLTPSLSIALSLSLTHSLSLSLTHTHSPTHSLSLSLSQTHTDYQDNYCYQHGHHVCTPTEAVSEYLREKVH